MSDQILGNFQKKRQVDSKSTSFVRKRKPVEDFTLGVDKRRVAKVKAPERAMNENPLTRTPPKATSEKRLVEPKRALRKRVPFGNTERGSGTSKGAEVENMKLSNRRTEGRNGRYHTDHLNNSRRTQFAFGVTKRLKRTGFLGLLILIFVASLIGLTLSRHSQMCMFGKAVDQGKLQKATEDKLCTNILEPGNWLSAVLNIFNFNFTNSLSVNRSYNPLANLNERDCTNAYLDSVCFLQQLDGQLKNKDGITNVLIAGSDDRSARISGNTDTLMVAKFNANTSEVTLISFPRDLILSINAPNYGRIFSKANVILPNFGKEVLENAVSEVIGEPIHYHAFFTFQTFDKVIDTLGGVDIEIEEDFVEAFPYVELIDAGRSCDNIQMYESGQFCIVEYPAGEYKFDSVDAHIYSRSRYLSSDFDRARRQQDVIKALINQILDEEGDLPYKLNYYLNLFSSLDEDIDNNFTTEDLTGLFKYIDSLSGNMLNVVLSPSLNKSSLVFEAGILPEFGYSTKFYDYTYTPVRDYLNKITKYSAFYQESPIILVVNTTGRPLNQNDSLMQLLNESKDFTVLRNQNTEMNVRGLRVYDFSEGRKARSLRYILDQVPSAILYDAEMDNITQSEQNEHILIIVGD